MRRAMIFLAVLAVAGCGGSGLSAKQAVRDAKERTAALETLRFSVTGQGFRGEGAVDRGARRSQVSVELGRHGRAEAVVVGDQVYARLGGGDWLSAGVEGLGSLLGGGSADPTRLDELLERLGDAGVVERVGRERVRGVETMRYRAEQLHVWVDDAGLVRRLRAQAVTIELYDIGADVAIEPPPPEQVTDLGGLMGMSG